MTALSKARSWEKFETWCRAHRLSAAPAHPWTVAAYIRSVEGEMRMDAIRRHLGHIGAMHYEKLRTRPDRHQIVKRTLESIRRQLENDAGPPVPVLFRPEDFISGTPPPTVKKTLRAQKADKKKGLRATPKLVRRKRV